MNGLVNTVRAKISDSCCTRKCQKQGCKVVLAGISEPFVLIDLDHPTSPATSSSKRCDFLYVSERWVSPIEMKRGKANASEIAPQLEAGARLAEILVLGHVQIAFRPVAVFGRGITKHEREAFKRGKIRFHQKRERSGSLNPGRIWPRFSDGLRFVPVHEASVDADNQEASPYIMPPFASAMRRACFCLTPGPHLALEESKLSTGLPVAFDIVEPLPMSSYRKRRNGSGVLCNYSR